MITIVGTPAWRQSDPSGPAGRACQIALSAVAEGSRVELIGRVGDDAAGDALLLGLARAGVGHAVILRDPARPTVIVGPETPADNEDPFADEAEADGDGRSAGDDAGAGAPHPQLEPADVSLGLRYLTAFDVLVVTDDVPPDVIPVAIEAAAFAGARLVVLVPPGGSTPHLPEDALVLGAPGPGGAFGTLVGDLAAGMDRGLAPDAALARAADGEGWEAVTGA
jgi:sugar/nucleoside kinase (ribokinase family)